MTKSKENELHDQMSEQCDTNARVYGPIFEDLKDCPEVSLRQIKERVRAHKKKLDWAIRFMQTNGGRVRVDRDRFVKAELVKWDKPAIEAAIDRQCISNVLPLGAVDFSGFPEVPGYPWTLCLLHHYVEHVSTHDVNGGFVMHSVSFASAKVSGLIVRKGTEEEWNWDLAFAQAAVEAGIEPNADAVGKFLLCQRCISGKCTSRYGLIVETMADCPRQGVCACELKQPFSEFIFATNTDGSGKASSYVRALDMLGPILTKHCPIKVVNGSMWHSFSLADIHAIHEWICDEMKKGAASPVLADFESPSYWTKNFCSAAVRAYSEFLAAEHFENGIVGKVKGETSGKAVAQKAEALIDTTLQADLEAHLNLASKDGKEKLAAVKVRVNQDIFRKMVLANYGGKCCVTGLMVPDVLRASHISPWAEDEKNRLNPENGLCLSATYDAAFDRHLISFDEHYRLIVSKAIKDHYTDAAAKSYFLDREGQTMSLPTKFLPSQTLLEKHRDLLAG